MSKKVFKAKSIQEKIKLPLLTDQISAANFFNLYWRYKFTISEIARLFDSDVTRILKILRGFEIPIRPLAFSPYWEPFINSQKLFLNGQSQDSKIVYVIGFRSFDLFVKIQKHGTPTDSFVQIKVLFGETKEDFYDYIEGSFGYLIQSEATTPISFCLGGRVTGSYMRINVTSIQGTTLNGSHYFVVSVKAAFK